MAVQQDKTFSEKHGAGAKPDPVIKDLILKRAQGGELSCAVAFQMARKLKVTPKQVGEAANKLNIKIASCQLGCFP